MISWVTLWPLLVMPGLIMTGLGALATVKVHGHLFGGAAVRQWCDLHLVVANLPTNAAGRLESWLNLSPFVHQWIVYLIIVANINTLLLPLLYVAGEVILRLHRWGARKDLQLKRGADGAGG